MKTKDFLDHFFGGKDAGDSPWEGKYKIPWDDEEFSRRMLREHLSQEHDLASRKTETIEAQVRWIHEIMLQTKPAAVLDLGCGPGFYSHRLAELGHQCLGVDFSPASIEYAHENNPDKAACRFVQGDLRSLEFQGQYDLVMMLFGELNVFSPVHCREILDKAFRALKPGGNILLEVHNFEIVKTTGLAPNTWQKSEAGLFMDRPHLCLIENTWDEESRTMVQYFHIIDAETGLVERFKSAVSALTMTDYEQILLNAGFYFICAHEDWPFHSNDFHLLTAKKE